MFDYESLFEGIDADDFDDGIEEALEPGMVRLSDISAGDEFFIGEEKFIVLDQSHGVTKVIRNDFLPEYKVFGNSADWKVSHIRDMLNNSYCSRLAEIIGTENIVDNRRDLTSTDGLDDYGACIDKVSLLTEAEYAKYHRILGLNSRYRNWWWTITPTSTPSNGYARLVCCVGSSGMLNWNDCDCRNGVRPFCILNSSVFVSLV